MKITPAPSLNHKRFLAIVTAKNILGNISTDSMENIMETKQNSVIQNRHLFIEKSDCSKCKYLDICYGGCVHDAIIAYGSPNNKTGLCKY